MEQLTLLLKPASGLCNLRCQYCFYEDVSCHRTQKNMGMMSRDTVECILSQAFQAVSPGGSITFFFQGGEPTLAGLDFFRDFMKAEKAHARPGISVSHGIQTNGYVLDREWVAFFREHDFLVGLSLDGTQALHDAYRLDAAGSGTWQHTVDALKLLEGSGVQTNLLCVVTGRMAKKANQVYRTLTGLGEHPLQLIPCLDPLTHPRGSQSYSLSPGDYGTFLCQLFDCWYRDWRRGRYVSIRCFEDYLRLLLRLPPSACAASGSCGHYLVVEGDGGLYPCDFYVLDRWYLGNIHQMSIDEALHSPNSGAFLRQGRQRPADCATCRYAPLCRGGCKRDWTEAGKNYYCPSYRRFFAYAIERLEEMAGAYWRG